MSSDDNRKKRKSAPLSRESGAVDTLMVIRLIIASAIFAVSLIVDMPKFLSIIMLVLAAAVAGYDIVLSAAQCVEEGEYFDVPVVVVLISVIAYFIDFSIEGAALLILYQIGLLLISYAEEHTRKSALDILGYQDQQLVSKMDQCIKARETTATDIEATMKSSAGTVLKFAMLIAVAYAILLPVFTNYSYFVSVHRAITIILIATPMSVIVSIPLAAGVGLCYCAQQGIVFESAAALEAVADAKIAVFDKDGIFEDETPKIIAMYSDIFDSDTFMNFVAHSVYYSDQPIARAIAAVNDQGYKLDVISDFRDIPGYGVQLTIDGMRVVLATRELFEKKGINIPPETVKSGQAFYMVVAGRYVGKVVISSDVNSESENLIPEMKEVGISRCILLSGESEESSKQFAELMNFSEMYAQCSPEEKLDLIYELAKKAHSAVLFIYADGLDEHSAATVDMRVGKRVRTADALVDPTSLSNIPFSKQVSSRVREIAIENAVFAFSIKAILIFLSIIGYCNLWFALFIDMVAASATILNTIRVTNESLLSVFRYKMGR